MEAATPLRKPSVRAVGDRLAIESLLVQDECAARLVRERGEAGEDPVRLVVEAIEIGARVLDREQAAANAEYVRAEFGKASKEVEQAFTGKARDVADYFGKKVGEANDQLARELERHFSDTSSSAVQHRVRELVRETLARSREELVQQFSAADGRNPLADFKQSTVEALKQADVRQHATQQALLARLGELERQLQGLRDERKALEALEDERERGTAKGRSFEEQVADAIDAVADAQGDAAEAVGDQPGAGGKTGDVVVSIGACSGPPLGRIVVEAKDRRLSRPKALQELDRALADRDADFALLVVPTDDEVPARMQPLREYNGDKLIVTLDPSDDGRLALEVGLRLARARVLMRRTGGEGIDAAAVEDAAARARAALDDVRRVKSQLSAAKTSIDNARGIVEAIATQTRARLDEIEALVRSRADDAEAAEDEPEADPRAEAAPDAVEPEPPERGQATLDELG